MFWTHDPCNTKPMNIASSQRPRNDSASTLRNIFALPDQDYYHFEIKPLSVVILQWTAKHANFNESIVSTRLVVPVWSLAGHLGKWIKGGFLIGCRCPEESIYSRSQTLGSSALNQSGYSHCLISITHVVQIAFWVEKSRLSLQGDGESLMHAQQAPSPSNTDAAMMWLRPV